MSSASDEARAARSAARKAASGGAPPAKRGRSIERTARKLQWQLGPDVLTAMRYAEANVSDLISQNEVKVLEFTDYGKLFIVHNNFSPDAFVQVAMAAAHSTLWGDMPSMYEPVLMKRFRHGRTEASRAVSTELVAFARIFQDDSASAEAKVAALRAAVGTVTKRVRAAASGNGCERHLYALKSIAARDGLAIPAFFGSRAWATLNHTKLSASSRRRPIRSPLASSAHVPPLFRLV